MHFYLTYKILNIKIYIKTLSTVTPTCFGPYGPSIYIEPSQNYFFVDKRWFKYDRD